MIPSSDVLEPQPSQGASPPSTGEGAVGATRSSSSSSDNGEREANKENVLPPDAAAHANASAANFSSSLFALTLAAPSVPGGGDGARGGPLPRQIENHLSDISASLLNGFPSQPPHTVQRLAELVLEPRRHYRRLAAFLHAVDRVVRVTSPASLYPLPPAVVTDMSAALVAAGVGSGGSSAAVGRSGTAHQLTNGVHPAAAVSWGNPASAPPSTTAAGAASLGSDESLGGALLSPIPWLTTTVPSNAPADAASGNGGAARRSPASSSGGSNKGGTPVASSGSDASPSYSTASSSAVRTESTVTIDGPNGVGHIETVSVTSSGDATHDQPSLRRAAAAVAAAQAAAVQRAVAEGRGRPQRGDTPSSDGDGGSSDAGMDDDDDEDDVGSGPSGAERLRRDSTSRKALSDDEDDEESEHARGPRELGAVDVGPQEPGLLPMTIVHDEDSGSPTTAAGPATGKGAADKMDTDTDDVESTAGATAAIAAVAVSSPAPASTAGSGSSQGSKRVADDDLDMSSVSGSGADADAVGGTASAQQPLAKRRKSSQSLEDAAAAADVVLGESLSTATNGNDGTDGNGKAPMPGRVDDDDDDDHVEARALDTPTPDDSAGGGDGVSMEGAAAAAEEQAASKGP